MVVHVLDALRDAAPERIVVVVGHGSEAMIDTVSAEAGDAPVEFAEQREQRGTGDAVAAGLGALDAAGGADADVLVLPGDAPLLRPQTVTGFVDAYRADGAAATLLTARLADPTGYGRIVRDTEGRVVGVVEQTDATEEQRRIDEVNTSMYCFRRDLLTDALGGIRPDNAQGEWYLTDVVGVLHRRGHPVTAHVLADPVEASGVNDRVQLAAAEACLRTRINEAWMRAGVTLVDPDSTWIEPTVRLGVDVTVYPGAVLRGTTEIGDRCVIGPHVELVDAAVGADAVVGASTVVESGSVIEPGARIAPLSRVTGVASGVWR